MNVLRIILAMTVLGTGCGTDLETSADTRWVLSTQTPAVSVPIPPRPGVSEDEYLVLDVHTVSNDGLVPISLEVRSVGAPGLEPRRVASVALFPPDNPGRFILPDGPLPARIRPTQRLWVEMTPIHDASSLTDVRLEFSLEFEVF